MTGAVSETKGIYLLNLAHADAIQRLASDPAVAATTRLPHPYPEGGARRFVEQMVQERSEGITWAFAIQDRGELVGVIGLHGVEPRQARELGFWIGRPYWGKGYASFAVKMVLEFAFSNLRLDEVLSSALESNAASRRVLEKNGAEWLETARVDDPLMKQPGAPVARYRISRARWVELKNAWVFARLHPALQGILSEELAAGNEIAESTQGWPEPESVFVQLRNPFLTTRSPLPAGVTFSEPEGTHSWRADYSTARPLHILAC
jgi:ribosomal-protein-alanine N-acetyltransferase